MKESTAKRVVAHVSSIGDGTRTATAFMWGMALCFRHPEYAADFWRTFSKSFGDAWEINDLADNIVETYPAEEVTA